MGVAVDETRRQQALFQHALGAVEIAEQPVQEPRSLHNVPLDSAPLVRRDQQRKEVEAPRPACIALALHRHDVVVHHEPVRFFLRALGRVATHGGEGLEHVPPTRPHLAVATRELVVGIR